MKDDLEQRAAAPAVSLTADDILGGADDRKLEAVAVATPEWKEGSHVFVAELSADERDQMEELWIAYKRALDDEESNVGFRAFTVAFCLCDLHRNRLFAGRESDVAGRIGSRNGKATSRVFNVCSKINGLTKQDIDELEKNSGATKPANVVGSGE
jgi:hypothetical protein